MIIHHIHVLLILLKTLWKNSIKFILIIYLINVLILSNNKYIFSLLRKELLNNDNSSYTCIINIIKNFMKKFNKIHSYNIFNKCFDIIKQ